MQVSNSNGLFSIFRDIYFYVSISKSDFLCIIFVCLSVFLQLAICMQKCQAFKYFLVINLTAYISKPCQENKNLLQKLLPVMNEMLHTLIMLHYMIQTHYSLQSLHHHHHHHCQQQQQQQHQHHRYHHNQHVLKHFPFIYSSTVLNALVL